MKAPCFIKALPIHSEDNFQTLHDQLAALSAETCVAFLKDHFLKDEIHSEEQDPATVSYCSKISKSDLEIKLSDTPKQIWGKIRAFSPAPGATLFFGNKRVKLLDARFEHDRLVLLKVKPEGKGDMTCKDFCLGSPGFLQVLREYKIDVG